eukprot:TRINITY_DN10416_c0_g1_i1.p1 TRINITY_DN10416_c0_g1~~TRINITY_DN10416_c0_g1_i1.p1  ORF type:complete len:163 (-),score=34.86 TRINITY_DN10416_c0_g1_i1:80-568(-)
MLSSKLNALLLLTPTCKERSITVQHTTTIEFKMSRQVVKTDKNAPAVGPYSPGIKASGSLLFVSGCVGLAPNGQLVAGGVVEQAKQALENMKNVLEAGGSSFQKVVKVTIFLRDMADFAPVNQLYATYFPSEQPARSTVAVAGLPLNALFEIECIALTDSNL